MGTLPLSRQQYGIWILQQAAPESAVANITFAFRTATALRWWPLNEAVTGLFARHRALRTRIPLVDGVPVQDVAGPDAPDLALEVRSVTEPDLLGELQAFARKPFDLATEFPFRVCHFVLDPGGSAVGFVLHHIVGDAFSGEMLMEELTRMYDGIARHNAIPDDLGRPFPGITAPAKSESSLRYWRERLEGVRPGAMTLPGSRPRSARLSFAGDTYRTELSDEARESLDMLSRRFHVTPNMVMMAVFLITLMREGLGPDLTIGVPVNTRDPRRYGVGLGVNTLALRVRAEPQNTLGEVILRTRETFLEGLAHSDVSVESVLDDLGHRSGDWRSPLFRQVFNWRSFQPASVIEGDAPEFLEVPSKESQFDLQLVVVADETAVQINVIYSTDVHEQRQISALTGRLDALLVAGAATPDTAVGGLDTGAATPDTAVGGLDIGATPGIEDGGPEAAADTPSPDGEPADTGDRGPVAGGPSEEITSWLLAWVEEFLGRRIDPGLHMFDQGLTSSRAVELVGAVSEKYAVELGIRPIFEAGTVIALAEAVTVALGDRSPAS
ncbi:hypothetical protein GCM10029978_112040 [Actinoallomurus acanthiterrae]